MVGSWRSVPTLPAGRPVDAPGAVVAAADDEAAIAVLPGMAEASLERVGVRAASPGISAALFGQVPLLLVMPRPSGMVLAP